MENLLASLAQDLELNVVLVTHDLAETIALTATVVVFSRQPARVLDVIATGRRRDTDPFRRTRLRLGQNQASDPGPQL